MSRMVDRKVAAFRSEEAHLDNPNIKVTFAFFFKTRSERPCHMCDRHELAK